MNDGFKAFTAVGGFIGRYAELVRDFVVPYQYDMLSDSVEGAEKSHAIANFRVAAEVNETGHCAEPHYGMVFQDSDLAKWLEAAAYSLAKRPDPGLEARCDAVIDLIGRAQCADGYLNSYFTAKEPEKRWTNLQEAHELYCAGHMMEAAVAYREATGKPKFMEIMGRMADHIHRRFITEHTPGYPGHPEVELALVRMYRATGDKKYLELAAHFVDARGADGDYYARERREHPWTVWGLDPSDRNYLQCHAPVREQAEATGHAVRAVYLYSGMADVALETKDEALKNACRVLWESITRRRMYLTGGIGSAYEGEQFTKDYHLPSDTAYSETCASVGLIFFARRMLDLEKNGEYADVMERALYNCVLAGMQLDGSRFFYVNPLEALPGVSGEAPSHKHALPQRPKWFACACCPPNVARLIGSIGRYAFSVGEDAVYCHLFVAGDLDLKDRGSIHVETGYPRDGVVRFRFAPSGETMNLTLAIRLPDWSRETKILRNGAAVDCEVKNGYAYLTGAFSAGDEITASFDMAVKRVFPSSRIAADSGRVAFTRGPLVYCAEGPDNEGDVIGLRVKKDAAARVRPSDKLEGIDEILLDGFREKPGDQLYSPDRPEAEACVLTLIPYYAWGNRGLAQMRVWIPEAE
jgi:DUF1680 family protein